MVAQLKFYADERKRWPELRHIDITEAWAERALKKLVRHFKLDRLPYGHGPVPIRFARKGSSTSWGGYNGIVLAHSRDWLIFLHEVAHVWEYRKHGRTDHRKRMARYVDRLCRYAIKMGWPQADLDGQFEAWCAEQVETEQAEAVGAEHERLLNPEPYANVGAVEWPEPHAAIHNDGKVTRVPVEAWAPKLAAQIAAERREQRGVERLEKIARKTAQLARLERRIKSLTTRAKKVKRSLDALRRATVGPADGRPLV
jgi:hypothetical protein